MSGKLVASAAPPRLAPSKFRLVVRCHARVALSLRFPAFPCGAGDAVGGWAKESILKSQPMQA